MTSFSASRVLPFEPYNSLEEYLAPVVGDLVGGEGLRSARLVDREVVIAELEASGLRGRGGAGFPTGAKWRTIVSYESAELSTSMVVNAAEGEPGTFKDRSILVANPYAVLEGALIGAHVVGARTITIATKGRFDHVVTRLRSAIEEVRRAGWLNDPELGDIDITVLEGPNEYLYGEETALLEVLDGRPPFPRIAPPWRRGVVEVVRDDDVDPDSGLAAEVEMATQTDDSVAPPVLVNNVETLANVAAIVAKGAAWFRSVGTEESPGTIVCTISGAVQRSGVVEVPMGTTLRSVLDEIGGGVAADRSVRCVLMGVSNAVLTPDELDLPISYEAMRRRGSGLGSASFVVIDDTTHPAALAAGASRFLAVESCGQCTACKQDGLQIADLLAGIVDARAKDGDLDTIAMRLGTVIDGARCSLATQHQIVIGSIIDAFPAEFAAQAQSDTAVEPYAVAELLRIDDETTSIDDSFADKQPDWTYAATDSGQTPAERLDEHRV